MWFDPSAFHTSTVGVARAYDGVAATVTQLAGGIPGGLDVFGEDSVRAAASAFHDAGLAETNAVSSALAEFAWALLATGQDVENAENTGGSVVDSVSNAAG
ncbi:hypothetical protein ACFXO9_31035 [Nocardia tengchongensis]|uniref:hypothetical protein n=1 Tax=Nocardia tengchongensis TaxID=2055889 RepID=UPI0036C26E03